MASIVVLSGAGDFSDPWHPFAETSEAIVRILEADGHDVDLREMSAAALNLDGVDLVVVNTGCGDPQNAVQPDAELLAAYGDFEVWHLNGGRILGIHTAANTFVGWENWPRLLGGRWERGVSNHPEISMAVFEPAPEPSDHPILDGLEQIIAYDERYSNMIIDDESVPLLIHETANIKQVCAWTKGRRALYDGLGHSGRSYESPTRADLLRREVDWLLLSQ